jgi:hypothetical protein
MPPYEPDAENEHARRPQPAELTEQIPAPGETRSATAPDEEKDDWTSAIQEPWASTLGQTDRDRSVSTPKNNTKPSSPTVNAGMPPTNPNHPAKMRPAW